MRKLNKSFVFCLMLIFIGSAFADIGLQDAKAQGLVGEMPDGYIGLVVSNTGNDVKRLVQSVNKKRRSHYQNISRSRNTSLSNVEKVAGEENITNTKKGHYYLNTKGKWVQK